MKSAKSGKERRKKKRWQVAVLVRCALPKFEHQTFELEMWAKDINETGMKLEWTKGLSVSQLIKDGLVKETHSLRFEDVEFNKGERVKIQDLFYDDDGSPFMEGTVLWARRIPSEDSWHLGVEFDDPKKQPNALMGAFKDFLSVVKHPTQAIAKASKKK